ncbi:uncharacterized protein METZ01_LOCUS161458, partial [marine metagenome]
RRGPRRPRPGRAGPDRCRRLPVADLRCRRPTPGRRRPRSFGVDDEGLLVGTRRRVARHRPAPTRLARRTRRRRRRRRRLVDVGLPLRPGRAHLRRHQRDPAQHHRRAGARPPEEV